MYVILRTESFAKLFILLTTTSLLLYITLAAYTYHTTFANVSHLRKYQSEIRHVSDPVSGAELSKRLKYILMWTIHNKTRNNISEGVYPFIANKCPSTNCYLTTNKEFLQNDYANFDAIIFDNKNIINWRKRNLPHKRSGKQKYVYYSSLPPHKSHVCSVLADEYFNWTCTYKLDSDIFNPFIVVVDLHGKFVAPKDKVEWERSLIPLTVYEKSTLKNKTKAVVMIVDKCETLDKNNDYVRKLRKAFIYNSLKFDIYGCGYLKCPKGNCLSVLHDYYFYYTVEDNDSADYVTDEVLKAYNTFTIPIVRGGADYHKFLPDGSYINARKTSIDKIVAKVEYIMRTVTVFYTYHMWRKYYQVKAVNPFQGMCKICEYLNDEEMFNRRSIKRNFRKWWNNKPMSRTCIPKGNVSLAYVLSYANDTKIYKIEKMM